MNYELSVLSPEPKIRPGYIHPCRFHFPDGLHDVLVLLTRQLSNLQRRHCLFLINTNWFHFFIITLFIIILVIPFLPSLLGEGSGERLYSFSNLPPSSRNTMLHFWIVPVSALADCTLKASPWRTTFKKNVSKFQGSLVNRTLPREGWGGVSRSLTMQK